MPAEDFPKKTLQMRCRKMMMMMTTTKKSRYKRKSNGISPKPQPNSKRALRLTKAAQNAEVLILRPYKQKLEKVQETKTQNETRTGKRKTSPQVSL
jgi:hypothetical protein